MQDVVRFHLPVREGAIDCVLLVLEYFNNGF